LATDEELTEAVDIKKNIGGLGGKSANFKGVAVFALLKEKIFFFGI
jgi:hypothetical protein